jgi:hypothetical protein
LVILFPSSPLLYSAPSLFIFGFFFLRLVCYSYSIKDLKNIIIPFFEKYPLITHKHADFLLFKSAVEIINSGEHLTSEGLTKILALKASMNNGLSKSLKQFFPGIIPVERPKIKDQVIKDAH